MANFFSFRYFFHSRRRVRRKPPKCAPMWLFTPWSFSTSAVFLCSITYLPMPGLGHIVPKLLLTMHWPLICLFVTVSGQGATAFRGQAERVAGSGCPCVHACAVCSSTTSSLSSRLRRTPCRRYQLSATLSSGSTSALVLPLSQTTSTHTSCRVKACFHYGCALRCVAREIESTLSASLYLPPRNATRSRNGNKP